MEVLDAQEVEVQEVTLETVLIVGRAIVDLLNTTPQISGKLLYALGKNEDATEKYVMSYRKSQREIVDKYALKNEDGSIKEEETETPQGKILKAVFKSEDDEQKFEKEMADLLTSPIEDFKGWHKVDKGFFEQLTVNPQYNKSFVVLVDNLSL